MEAARTCVVVGVVRFKEVISMTQLTIQDAIALKERGMQRAVDSAEREMPGWKIAALTFLKSFLSTHHAPFMAEEFRAWAYEMGLPQVSGRAFGSVMVTAQKKGYVRAAGFGFTKNPKAHRTPATVWIKN